MAEHIDVIVSEGSQDELHGFFQENYEGLVEFIDPAYIEGTLSGNYNVSCRGHVDEKFYILFTGINENGDDSPVAVYSLVN